jgi:hypothetical protein
MTIYHVTSLYIHSVGVVPQLDRGWCPRSLVMVTFAVTLLVRMMHEWVRIEKFLIIHCICRWWLGICLYRQHTRRCDWEEFDDREKFLDEVWRKGANLGKRIVYEKKEMREKYLKEPSGWILGTIKRELNLYASDDDTLEDMQDHQEMTLAYWR